MPENEVRRACARKPAKHVDDWLSREKHQHAGSARQPTRLRPSKGSYTHTANPSAGYEYHLRRQDKLTKSPPRKRGSCRLMGNPHLAMQTSSILLQADFSGRLIPQPDLSLSSLHGVERAIFRARETLEAGWQLTSDEAIRLFGQEREPASGQVPPMSEGEDEIESIADYFGQQTEELD